jgi:hypothetical protein
VVLVLPLGRAAAPPVPVRSPEELGYVEPNDATVRLLRQLGHPKEEMRTRAYKQLLAIGPPVIWQLYFAPSNGNAHMARLKGDLLADIQARHGIQPSRANGLEFRPFADLVWKIPAPGKEQLIDFGLKITNVGDKTVRFYLLDTVMPFLDGPNLEDVAGGGGRDGLPAKSYSTDPLKKGQSYTVSGFRAKLCRSADGKEVWVKGLDESSYFFRWEGLKPGRYYLSFGIVNQFPGVTADGSPPFWCGRSSTPYLVLEIQAPD